MSFDAKNDPEFWKWMDKNHPEEPFFAAIMKYQAPREKIQDKHKKKDDWRHNTWFVSCQFCDKFQAIADLGKIGTVPEHWAFKPWESKEYTTACKKCYQKAIGE
jgi:hypothetical protein